MISAMSSVVAACVVSFMGATRYSISFGRGFIIARAGQFRQLLRHAIELAKACGIPSKAAGLLETERTRIRSRLRNRAADGGMPHDDDVVANLEVPRNAHLAGDHAVLPNARAAGNTDERGHRSVRADV